MITAAFALILFLDIIRFFIIADIILSWLTLFGLNIRPKFLADVIDPLYEGVKKIIPTKIGIFDLTPIVVLIFIIFIKGIIIVNFPEINDLMHKLTSNL